MGTATLFVVYGLLVSILISFWMIYEGGLFSIQTVLILISIVLAWFWVVKTSKSMLLDENLYQKAKTIKYPPADAKKIYVRVRKEKQKVTNSTLGATLELILATLIHLKWSITPVNICLIHQFAYISPNIMPSVLYPPLGKS